MARVMLIMSDGSASGCAQFDADLQWMALDPRDEERMKEFTPARLHEISIDHQNQAGTITLFRPVNDPPTRLWPLIRWAWDYWKLGLSE